MVENVTKNIKDIKVKRVIKNTADIKLKNLIKNTGLNGSFTVEASFIMPIVVLVVLTLIFLGYSLYDQCRWEEQLQKGVLLTNQWALHPTEFDTGEVDFDKINERGVFFRFFDGFGKGGELFENYVLSAEENFFITEGDVPETELSLTGLKFEAVINRKIPDILRSFSSKGSPHEEILIRLHHPAETVRAYAALNDLVEGTKGLSELKEKISGILQKINSL